MLRIARKAEAPRTPEAELERIRQLAANSLWLTVLGSYLWVLAPFTREITVSRILLVLSAPFLLIMIEHALDRAMTAIADALGVPRSSAPDSAGRKSARQIAIELGEGLVGAAILIVAVVEGPHWAITLPLAALSGAALLGSHYLKAPRLLRTAIGLVLMYVLWYGLAWDFTRDAAANGRIAVLGGIVATLIQMVRFVRAAGAVRRRSAV